MDQRILLLLVLPAMVQCFECTEEFWKQTHPGTESNDFINRVELSKVDGFDQYFGQNSTNICFYYNEHIRNKELYLIIQNSNVSTLPRLDFSIYANSYGDISYSSIDRLYLRRSNIRFILSYAFQQFQSLQELYIVDNKLTEVSKAVFKSLRNLEILDLSNNRIRIIEDFSFTELTKLKKMFLSGNQLGDIQGKAFQGIQMLEILDLSKNEIHEIEDFAFEELNNLKEMVLSWNNLGNIDMKIFQAMTRLETLDLSYNGIQTIKGRMEYVSLKKLFLESNQLSVIDEASFQKLKNLEILDLSNNQIHTIEDASLKELVQLKEISLSVNQLGEINATMLQELKDVEVVDFSYNQVRTVEDFAFMGLKNLTKVFLNKNQLKEVNGKTLQGVRVLEILDLSENSIEKFSVDDVTIADFNLSYNQLETVNFFKFPRCDRADLSQNKISLLDSLEQANISDLNLSNNYLKFLNGTLINAKILIISNNEIKDLSLSFNRSTDLLEINLSFNGISSLDDNIFEGLSSLQSLDVSHNNLSVIQQVLFHDLENLISLNLSHNRIQNFRFGTFNNLKRLTTLNISHNRLFELNHLTFTPMSALSALYFEGNQISSLDANDLTSHFKRLRVISLADNQWKCQDLVFIFHHLQQHRVTLIKGDRFDVENLYGVACNSENSEHVDTVDESVLKEIKVKVNASLDDSNFVKFFNSSFKKTSFFKYFDNLKINTSLGDSGFVRFFNSSFRETSFFRYFDNFLKNEIAKEDGARQEKLVSVQRPSTNSNGISVVSLIVQIITALSLLIMIYLSFFKKSRRTISQVALNQDTLL